MKTVDAATLNLWLSHDEAVLIDVREPVEHDAERIAGAHLYPLSSLNAQALPDYTGKILVVHCLKGGRGQSACAALETANPGLEVYNLDGGIAAWTAAGFATEKKRATARLPIDRQTQLTIGLCVFTGSLLAAFVHPLYALIPAFFGAGLTMAGLTGFCGLARVLALMPWNRA
ncbi:rhodanese-like domain-containing protein [Asticcacaulis sp. BYS171W]|uniref:Rhodanese-like domain-containing protein n=1 Tax=Asticcacaulis aquaticus TaxID=2984212 RepID=A0ABT5HX85_9CAUL|nr:rhodanese-like domain-containing protein [Asticcacaulis aquaticus]MDC7684687.1 rhodanese-like domain-containing protein [Asticcacaulis aquaticus]